MMVPNAIMPTAAIKLLAVYHAKWLGSPLQPTDVNTVPSHMVGALPAMRVANLDEPSLCIFRLTDAI